MTLIERHGVVAEELGGALEQAGPGGEPAAARDPAVGGSDRARVVVVEDRVQGCVTHVGAHAVRRLAPCG